MSERTPMQTGSPYNPQNQPDASATDAVAPMQHTPERSLAERLSEAAVEELGLDERFVDFPPILAPDRRNDNELVVSDKRGLIEYNLETGELDVTNEFHEMVEVVNHNQHAATTLEQMILG